MTSEGAREALEFIWSRMARPLNPVPSVGALLGLPQNVVRQFLGATLATSDVAEDLLDHMPQILRSLSIATIAITERCIGEMRGPVLWNETMSARSASAGDPGLFVCSTPARAYDTPENQVLVAALDAIHRAGSDVERVRANHDDERIRRARHNGGRALRYLEHRSLAAVVRGRPTRRAIQRTRAGSRRSAYRPALAVIQRASEPVEIDHLLPFCDNRTTGQHDLLVAVIRQLERHGHKLPAFHVEHGVLRSGPVSYRHSHVRDRRPGGTGTGFGDTATGEAPVDGVVVGSVLLDVPVGQESVEQEAAALRSRTPEGLTALLVTGRPDVEAGVDEAIRLGF